MPAPLTRSRLAALLLLLLLMAFAGCGGKKDAAKEDKAGGGDEAEAAVPVQVAAATRGSIDRVIRAEAILFPINQANVMPKISAPVRRFLVNRGDHVRAGQLLAELESRDLAAAVAENKGNLDQAQAAYRTTTAATMPDDLTKAQTDVQSASQSLDAARKLYDNRVKLLQEGAIAQKLVDDAKVALVQAQSAYETAQRHLQSLQSVGRQEQVRTVQAQVDAARARLQNTQAQLSYAQVTSPISGVVADRPLNAGEMASAGNAVVSIVDISQVVARANVPVSQAMYMKVGQNASLTAGDIDLNGKVTVVSPAVDPNTTTVEVWIKAANPGERLKPGVTVKVAIHTQTINNAVLVPPAALLASDEGGQKVMVVGKDSKAQERAVEVGVRDTDKVQILKGVNPGENVITVGGLGLDDKAKVTVQAAGKKDDDDKDDKDKDKVAKDKDDKGDDDKKK